MKDTPTKLDWLREQRKAQFEAKAKSRKARLELDGIIALTQTVPAVTLIEPIKSNAKRGRPAKDGGVTKDRAAYMRARRAAKKG